MRLRGQRLTHTQAAVSALIALLSSAPLAAHAGGSMVASVQTASAAVAANQSAPTDRLIIKYRTGTPGISTQATTAERTQVHSLAQVAAARAGLGMTLLRVGSFDTHVMKLDRKADVEEVARLAQEIVASDPSVEYAEPDRIMQAQFVPNDTRYGEQWSYFEAAAGLNLPQAWDKATGRGVVVAVIDTGYRPHADLAANILPGYDFIADIDTAIDGNGRDDDALDPGDTCPSQGSPSSWHGTHVAGTIAAVTNNGIGVAGIAYNAKVVPVRVLGKCGGYTSDIADGIIWASGGAVGSIPVNANPARVLNLSLGGSGACGTTTQRAVTAANERGTVVVVAAGNSNANANNFSPASCNGVITVAALNRKGSKATYSNYGTVVTVAAPGGIGASGPDADNILSTLNSGTKTPVSDSYDFYAGTSMASPHVAGVVALMLEKNPKLTPSEVSLRLKASTRAFTGTCSQCGSGLVDANAAVDLAGGGVIVDPEPNTGDEIEPNDSSATAQLVAAGATINGTIGKTSDTDYFKLTVPAGASFTSTLTPNSSSDYDLFVYNSGVSQVGKSEKSTGKVDAVTIKNNGSSLSTYYVRVKYYSGGTGATSGKYTLSIK